MSIDLELDETARAMADAVTHFCRDRWNVDAARGPAGGFSTELWRALADLGALAASAGGGRAIDACAVMEALGAVLFPGPLAATLFAVEALPANERDAVAGGTVLASLAEPPLLPWAPIATVFLGVDRDRVRRLEVTRPIEAVDTLAAEPWGRAGALAGDDLGPAERPLALYRMALAAYLAAAGRALLGRAAEHARTRKQFGRPIGDFQAVAHPLADGFLRLAAAHTLARRAACDIDAGSAAIARSASIARASATRAALATAAICHQAFGAIGITLEGPAFSFSRKIRQLASLPPHVGAAHEDTVLASYGL